jgi:hypothetical protein
MTPPKFTPKLHPFLQVLSDAFDDGKDYPGNDGNGGTGNHIVKQGKVVLL